MNNDIRIPVITGATAAGKSDLILALAGEGLDFEVVSADAFQVYKLLDIGTAKPDIEFRDKIPHHLIDIVSADGSYNAGDFAAQAESVISGILSRGKLPVVTGGTGLYIQALRDGIFETPPPDKQFRDALRQRAAHEGNMALYEELKGADPAAAAKIHPNDLTRIIRALEVRKITGLPISKARRVYNRKPAFNYDVMVLCRERGSLYTDINSRVRKMLAKGWLTEVEMLLNKGYTADMQSFRAIGYREFACVLTGGGSLDSAAEITAQKTRNFAKRQLTWFRGMPDVTFMTADMIRRHLFGYKRL